jgi:hypothetical protein
MESKPGSKFLFYRVSGPLRQRLRGETDNRLPLILETIM